MTKDEAIDLIYEGLTGPESLPVKLRGKDGFDRELYARVEAAIRLLLGSFHGKASVPKKLACAFVDVTNAMTGSMHVYPEEEQEAIEAAAIHLVDLAYELFDFVEDE